MRYDQIVAPTIDNRKDTARRLRQARLYTAIYRDTAAILKLLLPTDKAFHVGNHMKSIMYALIELKTGIRPDKF